MIVGKVKIHTKKQKKNNKTYSVQQAIIYIKSQFIDIVKKYDGKEVQIVILDENEKTKKQKSDVTSDLLRVIYYLLFGKVSRKSNKEILRELKQKISELEQLL